MLLFWGVVAELRSARHDACSPLFRDPRDRMTAVVIQVTGVCGEGGGGGGGGVTWWMVKRQ